MHTKRYEPLTHELCARAALEAFDDKWFRKEYLVLATKYGGVTRAELQKSAQNQDWSARLEITDGIAYEMEQRVEDLLTGEAEDLDLDPVRVFPRVDGISMKKRMLSDCCPMHQCFGHLAVLGLRPLLKAKLLPYQFASIPGRGQVALKKQVEHWLRKTSLGIRHGVKVDVYKAYPSTKKAVVMKILRREIPGAAWLLAVISCLLDMSTDGGLLIGGYLESWLFNLVASYTLAQVLCYVKARRGETRKLVTRAATYMDDMVFLGTRLADLLSATRQITKWIKNKFGLIIKPDWEQIHFLTAREERQRRPLKGAAKGCPCLDMAGYKIHRTYTTIRARIFKRVRRQYLRAAANVAEHGIIPLWRAYRLVSYNGWLKNTKSRGIKELLNTQKLFAAAKSAIKAADQKKARAINDYIRKSRPLPAGSNA